MSTVNLSEKSYFLEFKEINTSYEIMNTIGYVKADNLHNLPVDTIINLILKKTKSWNEESPFIIGGSNLNKHRVNSSLVRIYVDIEGDLAFEEMKKFINKHKPHFNKEGILMNRGIKEITFSIVTLELYSILHFKDGISNFKETMNFLHNISFDMLDNSLNFNCLADRSMFYKLVEYYEFIENGKRYWNRKLNL